MELNGMKRDIVESYYKLIRDCKVNIENGIDKEKNEMLIKEYSFVLNEVEKTEEDYYVKLEEDMSELRRLSLIIDDYLAPLRPYNSIIA